MSYEYPYYSISKIRAFMDERNANPLKKWGQNFITDPNTLDFIINSIDKDALAKSDSIAEIGIGLGALTHKLALLNKKMFLFEIDPVYIENMKSMEYFDSANTELCEGDVLKTIERLQNEKVFLMGNLPYYITSEILTSSLKSIPQLTGAIFMVQKEFADRICNEISSLSIFVSAFGKFSFLKKISPSCFYPKPDASSALIRFTPANHAYSKMQIDKLELLLKTLFWGKRKTIGKSITEAPFLDSQEFNSAYPNLRQEILDSLAQNKIELRLRPEELKVEDYHRILKRLS
jgi:16S rRNA (adenine1518-N6/adenine1519-N6)-dimethyltransferase